jgi:hypothetical protein
MREIEMKRVQMVVGVVWLVAAVGCDTEAPTAAATQALASESSESSDSNVSSESSATEWLDEATQSIVFDPGVTAAWAELHLRINGTRDTNVRMRPAADGTFVAGPLALRADDVLTCSFTFLARGVGNDTATYTHVVPLGFEPRALRPEVRAASTPGAYQIRLVSTAKLAWADVHYALNGAPLENVRLVDSSGVLAHGLTLAPGDRLDYWMTYEASGAVFESGRYTFHPTVPTARTPWISGFPPSEPGNPSPIPAGCAPSNDWFTCAPYAFSRVSTSGGYHFADDATVVPFDITGSGPFGTSYIKTFAVAFAYAGAAPRDGVGLVQLPASAAHPGAPPESAEDRDRGKFVSPAWKLRAGYLIGGEGLSIALVDVNGLRSQALDVATYRGTYCRYGCSLEVPVAALAAGTDVDLSQIRYLELRTESGATVDPHLVLSHLLFDDFAF